MAIFSGCKDRTDVNPFTVSERKLHVTSNSSRWHQKSENLRGIYIWFKEIVNDYTNVHGILSIKTLN